MPWLRSIRLYQFKNYPEKRYPFDAQVVCISGKNGTGKTNLLDAIHFLCTGRSYFSSLNEHTIQYEKNEMRLEGIWENEKIVCSIYADGKKEIVQDDVAFRKFSDYLGRYPVVLVSPNDIALIHGYSPDRRKFMDILLSQCHPEYLQSLQLYNKALAQRNGMLKNSIHEKELFDIYDRELIHNGEIIYTFRQAASVFMNQHIMTIYHRLGGQKDHIGFSYTSHLHENHFSDKLKESFQRDVLLQKTQYGIHKDDLVFEMNGQSMKIAASQGQKKSFVFALKLASYLYLQKERGQKPVLLLDDIFEKLDKERGENLIRFILELGTQCFLTDTHMERMQSALKDSTNSIQYIQMDSITGQM